MGVDDGGNYQNTNTLTSTEKMEIVNFRSLFTILTNEEKYSGKPEDYLDRFLNAVNYLPDWPADGKDWAKSIMNDNKNDPDEGIAEIMKVMVNDDGNYQNTKTFDTNEKKEIVEYLLNNEAFMEAARKQFGSLLQNQSSL